MLTKIRLGISSCLLGEKVRFDGGHKLDRFITGTLGEYVEFVPVCPEAESGLGIPREAMHLVAGTGGPRLVTIHTREDHRARLRAWSRRRLAELEQENLWGYIFKSGSPSCGPDRVKIYPAREGRAGTGAGIFARAFRQHFPLLPAVDEKRLHDPILRENFLERLFVLKRWRETLALGGEPRYLADFHARHQLLLMSHSPRHCSRLGELAARIQTFPLPEVLERYQTQLMEALRFKVNVRKNVRVLLRVTGYLKKKLQPAEREELLGAVEDYRQGSIPLLIPVTLLNHYGRKYDQPLLRSQYYLNPPPLELKLRYHV